MSHSLNEIAAHAKRASRGAGLSWGMAEEASRATRWLASHDLGGPTILADLLAQNDGIPHEQVAPISLKDDWHARGDVLCPLTAGTALNDCADHLIQGAPIKMVNVSYPLLILPFAAWAAIHLQQTVRVKWETVVIDTDGARVWSSGPTNEINTSISSFLTCELTAPRADPGQLPGLRGSVTPEIWDRLDTFAQRILAPATDESRALGAGAGLSDND